MSSYSSSNTFGLLQARPRDGALRPVESRIRQPVHLRARLVNGTQHFAIQIPVCSTLILSGWVARKHGRKFKRLLRRSLTSTARLCAAFYSGWYNSDCHQREVAPRDRNAITRRGEGSWDNTVESFGFAVQVIERGLPWYRPCVTNKRCR